MKLDELGAIPVGDMSFRKKLLGGWQVTYPDVSMSRLAHC